MTTLRFFTTPTSTTPFKGGCELYMKSCWQLWKPFFVCAFECIWVSVWCRWFQIEFFCFLPLAIPSFLLTNFCKSIQLWLSIMQWKWAAAVEKINDWEATVRDRKGARKTFSPSTWLTTGWERVLAEKNVNDEKAMKAGRNDDKMALINAMWAAVFYDFLALLVLLLLLLTPQWKI